MLNKYSNPPLIGTPIPPNYSVLFREVFSGEREHITCLNVQYNYCAAKAVSFLEECPFY